MWVLCTGFWVTYKEYAGREYEALQMDNGRGNLKRVAAPPIDEIPAPLGINLFDAEVVTLLSTITIPQDPPLVISIHVPSPLDTPPWRT